MPEIKSCHLKSKPFTSIFLLYCPKRRPLPFLRSSVRGGKCPSLNDTAARVVSSFAPRIKLVTSISRTSAELSSSSVQASPTVRSISAHCDSDNGSPLLSYGSQIALGFPAVASYDFFASSLLLAISLDVMSDTCRTTERAGRCVRGANASARSNGDTVPPSIGSRAQEAAGREMRGDLRSRSAKCLSAKCLCKERHLETTASQPDHTLSHTCAKSCAVRFPRTQFHLAECTRRCSRPLRRRPPVPQRNARTRGAISRAAGRRAPPSCPCPTARAPGRAP